MSDITVKSLLEAGVHFGHQTHRWNPKMAPWLFGERSGVHIIDLEQTMGYLNQAAKKAEEVTASGGKILFVGTKRQGREVIKTTAEKAGMPYVIERWLGGTLTNWTVIQERLRLLARLTDEQATGDWDRLPKKEVAKKQRELERLQKLLGGLKDLGDVPEAVFVNDVVREDLAIKEAHKLGLIIIGVVDSNADPSLITHPIPGNDDAVRSIAVVAGLIADAALRGKTAFDKQARQAEPEAKPTASKAVERAS